jgi:hypothetical protein
LGATLGHRTAEFNHFRRRAFGYSRRHGELENKEETTMRLKLLSPGEMNENQRQTYDESIAG